MFGPRPRDYRFKLNKKVKVLARKSALSYKAQEDAIIIVEDFTFPAPKTKDFINITKNLKVEGKKTLLLLPSLDKNVYLSARNLPRAEVMIASTLNAYMKSVLLMDAWENMISSHPVSRLEVITSEVVKG